MRIGTFLCWLFGHKFIYQVGSRNKETDRWRWELTPTQFCVRCGIEKLTALEGKR